MATTLGARLRAAREKSGLKSSDVCKVTGIANVQILSAYERDARIPGQELLQKMAKLYQVSEEELLGTATAKPAYTETSNTKANYIRQLVEAASALNLSFLTKEDPEHQRKLRYLALDDIEQKDFFKFTEKWAILAQLYNDGVINKEEYMHVVHERLEELDLDADR